MASALDDARMVTRMKITELKREMDAQFAAVRERFAEVNARFAQVDARFEQVDARFEQVDARFDRLEQRMVAEHETTRRYMDIVAEQFGEYVKMLADGIGLNTERLDRHEKRITALEERRWVRNR
jgi:predicted nuclease with TOPRIM domain